MAEAASAVLLPLLAAAAQTPPEQDPVQVKLDDLDARVTRIERVHGQPELALSQPLDELQARLRELRGRIEELENSNEALRKQQRDLYDRRLARRRSVARSRSGGPLPAALAGAAGSGRRRCCGRRARRQRAVLDRAGGLRARPSMR